MERPIRLPECQMRGRKRMGDGHPEARYGTQEQPAAGATAKKSAEGSGAKNTGLAGLRYSVRTSPARSLLPAARNSGGTAAAGTPSPTTSGDRISQTRSTRPASKKARASVGPGSTSRSPHHDVRST